MYRASLIMILSFLLPAGVLLLTAGFSLSGGDAAEEHQLELVDSSWVVLHAWLPENEAAELLPEGLIPQRLKLDIVESSAPGAMVDLFLIIRTGTWHVPLGGKQVSGEVAADALLCVAAADVKQRSGLYVVDWYTDSPLLQTWMRQHDLKWRSMEADLAVRSLPNGQEEIIGEVGLENHEPWRMQARTVNTRHYALDENTWRLFLPGGGEISLEMQRTFFMRAQSRLEGYRDNMPFDRLGDWRWADRDTLMLFTTGRQRHMIRLIP